jgi:hypothetical protein
MTDNLEIVDQLAQETTLAITTVSFQVVSLAIKTRDLLAGIITTETITT